MSMVGWQVPFWAYQSPDDTLLDIDPSTERVWDTERKKSGKRPWQWLEFEVDRCRNIFGQAPCTATGTPKCFNSWETCKDEPNFSAEPFWLRIAEPSSEIPRDFEFAEPGLAAFVPILRSVQHTPGLPDPGETLGARSELSVKLQDAPHHDLGVDKYVRERMTGTYFPMEQSTFLRKTKARWPHYIGRRIRWYQGYITDAPSYSDFRRREYLMERWEGPDTSGDARIVSKDILKMLDDDRAQAPMKSNGKLSVDLDDATSPATLDVVTTTPTEYDLKVGEAADYARIGKEVITYTGTTAIAAGVRLTGVTYAAPFPYETVREDHKAGDIVQRCRLFSGTIPAVAYELMVSYAGVDPAYIRFADWEAEAEEYIAGDSIQRLVTEPEGIRSLLNEIISQTLTWAFWFDEVEQLIKYRAIRPPLSEHVVALNDDAHIVSGSVSVTDDPEKIINEVQVLYGQRNPVDGDEKIENYRRGLAVINSDSQGPNELRKRRIKRVFARWHPATNDAVVDRWAFRKARSLNLVNIAFRLERKDELATAEFANLTTLYVVDAFGLPRTLRVQVLRADSSGEEMSYRAREDFFRQNYGRLGPPELDGLLWTDATDEQRERYMFLAQVDGKFTNGDEGKALL